MTLDESLVAALRALADDEGDGAVQFDLDRAANSLVALALQVDQSKANLRLAKQLLDSFDPTSGSARAATFVADLRNCLEAW